MSECVVRMEMPAQCASCPMWRMDFFKGKMLDLCRVNGKYMDTPYGERPDWCPIICQLPEGHGRLVDADKLADNMKARKAFFGRMSDPQCLVEDAPTIVPAERSEG